MTESHSPDSSAQGAGAKDSFGTRIKNRFKAQSIKKRVVASISTLGVLALASFAVSPTVANWNSEEELGTTMQAGGNFGLQINTGNGWTSTGNATISFDDFAYWAPNDNQTHDFRLRMDPNSSHSGVISLADCGAGQNPAISVNASGQPDGYIWEMHVLETDNFLQGSSLNDCRYNPIMGGSGKIVLHPDNTSGQGISLSIFSNSDLQQAQDTTFNLTFTAEQLTHTEASNY